MQLNLHLLFGESPFWIKIWLYNKLFSFSRSLSLQTPPIFSALRYSKMYLGKWRETKMTIYFITNGRHATCMYKYSVHVPSLTCDLCLWEAADLSLGLVSPPSPLDVYCPCQLSRGGWCGETQLSDGSCVTATNLIDSFPVLV